MRGGAKDDEAFPKNNSSVRNEEYFRYKQMGVGESLKAH